MGDLEAALKTRLNAYLAANNVRVEPGAPVLDAHPYYAIDRAHTNVDALMQAYERHMAMEVRNYERAQYTVQIRNRSVELQCRFY